MLTPDELLTTTRAVRHRLDLSRPVDPKLLRDCLRVAQQAPNANNRERWHFVVLTDPIVKAAMGNLWQRVAQEYLAARYPRPPSDPAERRMAQGMRILGEKMPLMPALVLPCVEGRTEGASIHDQATRWASIHPATWSFMLAARARGLGTSWTTLHLRAEREAADLVGIPFDRVMQTALIPVAYYSGSTFSPAVRRPLSEIAHWDAW